MAGSVPERLELNGLRATTCANGTVSAVLSRQGGVSRVVSAPCWRSLSVTFVAAVWLSMQAPRVSLQDAWLASDIPSDNDPRHHQTGGDALRHRYPFGLR